MAENCGVVLVQADLVVDSGRDQGNYQDQKVEDDGNAARTERKHHLQLPKVELSQVVPKVKFGNGLKQKDTF